MGRWNTRTWFVAAWVALSAAAPAIGQLRARFAAIPPPADSAFTSTEARYLSADGTVAAGVARGENVESWFVWTAASGIVFMPTTPDGRNRVAAIAGVSGDGSVVVGNLETVATPRRVTGFRYTQLGGYTLFPSGFPAGASASGNETVLNTSNAAQAMLVHVDGVQEQIAPLAGTSAVIARGISADGRVVFGGGNLFSSNAGIGFFWTSQAGTQPVGDLPGALLLSVCLASSADGGVVAGFSSSLNDDTSAAHEAFGWTAASGIFGLGDLLGGEFNSTALGVSGDGGTIVGEGTLFLGPAAFIWDAEHGIRDLRSFLVSDYGLATELDGWELRRAVGISGDGRSICGTGVSPKGRVEGWVVTFVPMCAADFNGDGAVDSSDFFEFVACFFGGGVGCDVNGDGVVDSADFFGFLEGFFVGCG